MSKKKIDKGKPKVRNARFVWPEDLLQVITDYLKINLNNSRKMIKTAEMVKNLSDLFLALPAKHRRSENSEGQVIKSNLIDIYGDDPALMEAYTAYYLLVNIPKIVEIIEDSKLPLEKISEIIDIGTGSGTAILGFLIARNRAGITSNLNITALDHSRKFLETARNLTDLLRRVFKISGKNTFQKHDLNSNRSFPVVADKNSTVLLMAANAIAELSTETIDFLPTKIDNCLNTNDYLLFIEPAQRFPARRLLKLRDRLCNPENSNWCPVYPCPGNFSCPALVRSRDWCHHRLKWNPPELIQIIDKLNGMRKTHVNFTPLVMKKNQPDYLNDDWYRVVSETRRLKGKFEVTVCGNFDDRNNLKICMLENKHVSSYNKVFLDLARYDQIRLKEVENCSDRVKLSVTSRLTRKVDDGDRG